MPTPTKGARLGGGPAHERLMLANLATQLFQHQSITTTQAKARRLRPYAERLITFAKRGDLASRRRVMRSIRDGSVVHVLFTEIGPAMAERAGGYTRIVKVGPRKGDAAPMAVIQLVMEPVKAKKKRSIPVDSAEASRGSKAAATVVAQAEEDAAVVAEQVDVAVGDLVEVGSAEADQVAEAASQAVSEAASEAAEVAEAAAEAANEVAEVADQAASEVASQASEVAEASADKLD